MQKRIISIIIIILGCLIITSCGKSEDKPNIVGGWEIYTENKTIDIPISAKTAFEKAYKEYDEIKLEPIALLATEVKEGTNYMFLCLGSSKKNASTYKMVVVNNNQDNKAKITSVKDLELAKYANQDSEQDSLTLTNNWVPFENFKEATLPTDIKKSFEDATKNFEGMTFKPIALLGSQVVSGKNYAILALGEMTADKTYYTIDVLTIYVDLNNNSLLSQLSYLNLSDFSN